MRVEITQSDIGRAEHARDGGEFSETEQCVVATAVERITGRKTRCGFYGFSFTDDPTLTRYRLPPPIMQLVEDFMARKPIKPTTFFANPE